MKTYISRIHNKNNEFSLYLLLICSSVLGILFLSYSTSPLYNTYGSDSAIFQTIGKYWTENLLPYIDLFDHKGPLIFFINAVGYSLTQNKYGIVVIEIVFLFFTELYAFKILKRKKTACISAILASILPFFMILDWGGGNYTEEYILPFLMLSLNLVLHWFENTHANTINHPPINALIYGITFGIALMTRITNAFGLIIAIIFITLCLLLKKAWKNLFQNIVAFLLGVIIIVTPFCVYFHKHDALYEMWYGTLLYNFDYLANTSTGNTLNLKDIIYFFRISLPGWCLLAISSWKIFFKKQFKNLFWFICVACNIAFIFFLHRFVHYSLCLFPYLYVAIALLWEDEEKANTCKHNINNVLLYLLIGAFLINSTYYLYRNPPNFSVYHLSAPKEYSTLINHIPSSEKNSFIAVDTPVAIYLDENIKPACKYFIHQSWQASSSEILTQKIVNDFEKNNVQWILIRKNENQRTLIDNVLILKYKLVMQSSEGNYYLYKLIP